MNKVKDSFLAELHAEILSHENQEATGIDAQPVPGITVHDSDVLQPEPARAGGLLQKGDAVRGLSYLSLHDHLHRVQRHTFRQPARPIEPPTPRTSLLGLDRLAKEKRDARGLGPFAGSNFDEHEGSRKRARLDGGGDSFFKGMTLFTHRLRSSHPSFQYPICLLERTTGREARRPHHILVACQRPQGRD